MFKSSGKDQEFVLCLLPASSYSPGAPAMALLVLDSLRSASSSSPSSSGQGEHLNKFSIGEQGVWLSGTVLNV